MSKINITLDTVVNGKQVSFVAPCTSDNISHLTINGNDYTICDSNNNNIGNTGGLWASGAIVSVIINSETKRAYIQNAVTPEIIGAAKIEIGSYVGTGTYGERNPVVIATPFPVKTIIVTGSGPNNGILIVTRPCKTVPTSISTSSWIYGGSCSITWEDNKVSWYGSGNEGYDGSLWQFNVYGSEYTYTLLG